MKNTNPPQETVDADLVARFTEIRLFYSKTQVGFAKLFKISKSVVSDIERGERNPSQALLNRVIARGDYSAGWVLEGREPKQAASMVREQAPRYGSGVKPGDWRKAVEIVEAGLKARGLAGLATDAHRDLMVQGVSQGVALGVPREALQEQLIQLMDLVQASIGRKARGQ